MARRRHGQTASELGSIPKDVRWNPGDPGIRRIAVLPHRLRAHHRTPGRPQPWRLTLQPCTEPRREARRYLPAQESSDCHLCVTRLSDAGTAQGQTTNRVRSAAVPLEGLTSGLARLARWPRAVALQAPALKQQSATHRPRRAPTGAIAHRNSRRADGDTPARPCGSLAGVAASGVMQAHRRRRARPLSSLAGRGAHERIGDGAATPDRHDRLTPAVRQRSR